MVKENQNQIAANNTEDLSVDQERTKARIVVPIWKSDPKIKRKIDILMAHYKNEDPKVFKLTIDEPDLKIYTKKAEEGDPIILQKTIVFFEGVKAETIHKYMDDEDYRDLWDKGMADKSVVEVVSENEKIIRGIVKAFMV
jgi:START domain